MTDESNGFDIERLADLAGEIDEYVIGFKEAIVSGEGESDLVEIATDLWDVLDELEDVLGTIDLEGVSESIDFEKIPDAIDVEDIPEGLFNEEENAIELTSVKEAVNLRELWDAVDLTDLYQEKQELDNVVDKVTDHLSDGEDEEDGGLLDTDLLDDDEDDGGLFEGVVGMGEGANISFDAEARQAVIEEKIQDAVMKFREMILTAHEKLHKLYKMNQEKLGQPGRQPNSLNPTAVSTLPAGPVPNSASLRASTVPSQVRHSRVKNPRRIYGHRFSEAIADGNDEKKSANGDDAEADEEADEAVEETAEADDPSEDEGAQKSESVESSETEEPNEDDSEEDEEIALEIHNE